MRDLTVEEKQLIEEAVKSFSVDFRYLESILLAANAKKSEKN